MTEEIKDLQRLVLTMATRRLMDIFGEALHTDPELRMVQDCLLVSTESEVNWYREVRTIVFRAAKQSPSLSKDRHRVACPLCGEQGERGYLLFGGLEAHLRKCDVWWIFSRHVTEASERKERQKKQRR